MLSLDANFRLKSKERGFKDVRLGDGRAYVVKDVPFLEQVANATNNTEVRGQSEITNTVFA